MSARIAAWVPAKVAHGFSVALVLSVAEVMLKYSEMGRTELSWTQVVTGSNSPGCFALKIRPATSVWLKWEGTFQLMLTKCGGGTLNKFVSSVIASLDDLQREKATLVQPRCKAVTAKWSDILLGEAETQPRSIPKMEKLSWSVFLKIVRTLWSHRNVSSLPQTYRKITH